MARHFGVVGIRSLITGVVLNAIEFPAPLPSRLTRIFVRIAAANEEGDALFDVKVNGTTIFASPADRPTILSGETSGFVEVDVEMFENDLVSVDVVSAPLGGITGLYILVQVDDSPTAVQYVRAIYQGALGRNPTTPESSDAVTTLESGCAGNTMLDATKTFLDDIFTSAEYLALATMDTQYVQDLYRAILGRPPDSGGLAFWVANLGDTGTRQTVRDAFNLSNEHVLARVIGFCPNTLPGANAIRIQDWPVSTDDPTTLQVLTFDGTEWVPADPTGGGGGGITVRLASTANVDIASAPSTLDGIALVAGDRVLLKNQTSTSENGIRIFTAAAAALARSADVLASGMIVVVTEGTANDNKQYMLTTNNPIVPDTTAMAFVELVAGGAPSGTAGGDLSGTYPNPSVAKVGGVAITGTPSAGQVPIASTGTAAAWGTPSGGGSYSHVDIEPPPGSPNAMDDEFTGGSLDAKWTKTAGAGSTDTYNSPLSWLNIDLNTGAWTTLTQELGALGQAFDIIAKVQLGALVNSQVMFAGLVAGGYASHPEYMEVAGFGLYSKADNSGVFVKGFKTSGSPTNITANAVERPYSYQMTYLRLIYATSGSTIKAYSSPNGQFWTYEGVLATSDGTAIARVGLVYRGAGSAGIRNVGFDFFRRLV